MTEFTVKYTPEKLSELSEVEICKNLWTHSHIKKSMKLKVQEFLAEMQNNGSLKLLDCDADEKILNEVFNNVNKLPLPVDIKQNLKILTKKIGFVIWDWLNETHNKGNTPVDLENYLDYIKWTKDGDIDSTEILRSMYYAKILPDDNNTWIQLTSSCLEDCIADYFNRIKPVYHKPVIWTRTDVLPLYWNRRMENRLGEFGPELKSILQSFIFHDLGEISECLEVNLLRVSIAHRNHSAVKYFWDALTDDQRLSILNEITETVSDVAAETAAFFWKAASIYHFNMFFFEILGRPLFMRRLINWPYENLLMRTLEESWPQLNDFSLETMMYGLHVTLTSPELDINSFKKISLIFQQIWGRIEGEHKKSLDCVEYLDCFAESVDILCDIINDPALVSKRDEHIEFMADRYKWDFNDRNMGKIVDEFCEVVLVSEKEKQMFKNGVSNFSCTLTLDDLNIDDIGDFVDSDE